MRRRVCLRFDRLFVLFVETTSYIWGSGYHRHRTEIIEQVELICTAYAKGLYTTA